MFTRAQVYPKEQKVICWSHTGKTETVAYTYTFANLLPKLLPEVRIIPLHDTLVIEYNLTPFV